MNRFTECNMNGFGASPVSRPNRVRWAGALAALFAWLATLGVSFAGPSEYDVKAAFLLNFAKFVEWPPQAYADTNAPIVIGIVGDNPFGDTLQRIVKDQTTQGRRIEIREFKADEDCSGCQVLFLSRSVAGQSADSLNRVKNRPVLTVSDSEDFVRQGGVIGFALVDKTVRFDINSKVAEAAELKLSSKLLAVARTVMK